MPVSVDKLLIMYRFYLGFVLLAGAGFAQDVTGALSGTVADSSGAVVAGATVMVTNSQRGTVVFQAKTSDSGVYSAAALQAGIYNIRVEAKGFKRAEVTGIALQVKQRARIDVTLAIGDVAETISVIGEGLGQLEAESSSMGAVINTTQVKDLPMPNRNILNLLTLVGGVSSGGAATGINASQLSINGSRTLNSEFTVDGVSVVSGSTGGVQRMPSTEAIREFRVLTSGYTAEYGRTSGGFVSVISDSGTNDFHGSLYEYFRNEKLNANNFFRNVRGQVRQTDRYNQFGGKLGGPVVIPKLYNGKDRSFFFFNYEGLRRISPFNNLSTLPDAAYRTGDFSRSPVSVFDSVGNVPFQGNRIPASRLDAAGQKVLGLLPAPNQSGIPDTANGRTLNNYLSAGSNGTVDNQFTMRGDHSIGGAARLSGRWTKFSVNNPSGPIIPGPLDSRVGNSLTTGHQVSLSWTHYRALLKVDRPPARQFYEIEAIKNGWSARQLERQINSLLFDRLGKS